MRFWIETTVSKRNTNGNRYSYSTVRATGGNILHIDNGARWEASHIAIALRKAGVEYSDIAQHQYISPIREFQRARKALVSPVFEHEVTTDMLLALEQ